MMLNKNISFTTIFIFVFLLIGLSCKSTNNKEANNKANGLNNPSLTNKNQNQQKVELPDGVYTLWSQYSFDTKVDAAKGSYIWMYENIIQIQFYYELNGKLNHYETILTVDFQEIKIFEGVEGVFFKGTVSDGNSYIGYRYNEGNGLSSLVLFINTEYGVLEETYRFSTKSSK